MFKDGEDTGVHRHIQRRRSGPGVQPDKRMYVCMYVCMVITYSRVWINRVRLPILLVVSWTGKNNIPLSPCMPENLVSRDGFSRPVPRQPAHLHTQAESGAYLRDSSRVPRRRPFMKPPYAIRSVPSLSGHAIAYRWRSLPRVRWHRASKPQGSSDINSNPMSSDKQKIVCSWTARRHGLENTTCSLYLVYSNLRSQLLI